MLGDLIGYAASRAMNGAVDSATRRASWTVAAVLLFGAGLVFTLMVGFWLLYSQYSAPTAGLVVAGLCFIAGAACLMMPRVLDWLEARSAGPSANPAAEVVAVVDEEVADAVDYFGPVRVVASALLLGFGIARTIRR